MLALASQTDSAPAEGQAAARSGGLRRAAVLAIVVAATVAALASVLAVWVQRQVLDTDTYVRTSSAMLDDPAVRAAIANYAVDEIYRQVDVQAELEDVLPNDADRFANAAAAALRPVAYQVVDQALRTSVLASLWETANRQAHEQFVRSVVKGGGAGISTEGGVVRLGLRPLLVEATRRIGLGESLAERIPADAGTIEVLRSNELGVVQDSMRLLDAVAKFLPFVALGLYALAVWLARDRRREALRNIGIGLVVGGGLLLLLVGVLEGIVLDRVVTQPEARDAAAAVWQIVESPLGGALWAVVALGAVLALGAALAGPGRNATAVRRTLAPYLEWRGYAIGAGTALVLVLLLTGAIDSFTRFAWLVIFGALAGFGFEALRRQTLREFPDAERPPLADWLRARWGDLSDRGRSAADAARSAHAERTARSREAEAATGAAAPEPPAPASADPRPPVPSLDDLERLERLAGLHQSGALTDEEFAVMKARLVNPSSPAR
jgi:hypothetical protein